MEMPQAAELPVLTAAAVDDEHEHGRADDVGAVVVNIDEHDSATPISAPKYAQKKWLASAEAAAGAEEATADDSVPQSLDVELSVRLSFCTEESSSRTSSRRRRDKFRSSVFRVQTLIKAGDEARASQQAAVNQAAAVSERLSLAAAEDEPLLDDSSRSSMDSRVRRQRILSMVVLWALPTACCVWYAAAIFFPVGAQAAVPALLWTPGAAVWVNGKHAFKHEGGYDPFTVDLGVDLGCKAIGFLLSGRCFLPEHSKNLFLTSKSMQKDQKKIGNLKD